MKEKSHYLLIISILSCLRLVLSAHTFWVVELHTHTARRPYTLLKHARNLQNFFQISNLSLIINIGGIQYFNNSTIQRFNNLTIKQLTI